MATSTWSGSIRLAGFPVSVRVYDRVKNRYSQSFNMLDPVHKQPVKQQYVDVNGGVVDRAATLRGFKDGDQIRVLSESALALLERTERSGVVDIDRFSPPESIPFHLAISSYVLTPDEKIPGSQEPVDIFWNGLRATGLAAVIPNWAPKSGSKPSTLVVVASDTGLLGYLMPFAHEIRTDIPKYEPEVNDRAAQIMRQFIDASYTVADYAIDGYRDESAERREQAIRLALAGDATPLADEKPAVQMKAPSLLDALAAAMEEKKPARATKSKPARAKAQVKA